MNKVLPDRYNVPNNTIQFDHYLVSKNVSKVSRKNYLSDLRAYLLWIEAQDLREHFSLDVLISYKEFLISNRLPVSSINRSLSSLRSYGDFLLEHQTLFSNPARLIRNVVDVSGQTKKALIKEFTEVQELNQDELEILHEFLSTSL